MPNMTADEYQRLAMRFDSTPEIVRDSPLLSRLIHASMGVATEGGEMTDHLKKHVIYGRVLDQKKLLGECGDVLWYITQALDACGFTLTQCMEANIDKLSIRYPDLVFTTKDALERDLEAEEAAFQDLKPAVCCVCGQRKPDMTWQPIQLRYVCKDCR